MAAASTSSSGITERVVLLFLVAASLVLGWIRFHVMPAERVPEVLAFDLRNPMLDAESDECVQIESTSTPGSVICLRVQEPGVVLRPRNGPTQLGIYRGLRRARPYLATVRRSPPPGKSCADAAGSHEEIELFDLNAYGMPYNLDVTLDQVRPLWVKQGSRYQFVYEVQLTQYGMVGRTWQLSIKHSAPVTGIVRREHAVQGGTDTTLFLPAEDCR